MSQDIREPDATNKAELFRQFDLLDSPSEAVAARAFWDVRTILQATGQKIGDYVDIQKLGIPGLEEAFSGENIELDTGVFLRVKRILATRNTTLSASFTGDLKNAVTSPAMIATGANPAPFRPAAKESSEKVNKGSDWKTGFAYTALALCGIVGIWGNNYIQKRNLEAKAHYLSANNPWGEKSNGETPAVLVTKSYLLIDTTQWVYVKDSKGSDVVGGEGKILHTYCRETGSIDATKIGNNYKVFPGAMNDNRISTTSKGWFLSSLSYVASLLFNPKIKSEECATLPQGPLVKRAPGTQEHPKQ